MQKFGFHVLCIKNQLNMTKLWLQSASRQQSKPQIEFNRIIVLKERK